jgi:hypothetical protein
LSVSSAGAAVAIICALGYAPGWAVARALALPMDTFARLWIGFTITSVVGLVLGEAGRFSIATLTVSVAAVTLVGIVLGTRRAVAGPETPPPPPAVGRSVRAFAIVAAAATIVWSWPPYETIWAASDSTMYVNAGLHLARTGRFAVPDTVVSALPRALATGFFPSVGWHGTGPFVRLPGGLLMGSLDDAVAIPAFFPLLSVWTAILGAAGGAPASVLAAPLFAALTVWAVVLFAGEVFGLATAAATALVLIANFALWWFAKFTMPEPLAAAAVWSGFVLLHRAASMRDGGIAFFAGAVFGIAGLARTETLLFLGAAGVLTWAWTRVRAPVIPLVAGLALVVVVATLGRGPSPSHHLAYLRNEIGLHYLAILPSLMAARANGRLQAACAVIVLAVLAAAIAGRRSRIGLVRGMLRLVAPLATAAAVVVYVRIAAGIFPRRDLEWLALYCSWPLLALAVLGAPVVWRRDGDAVRLAACAWLLATIVFGLNPRISPYQPWAIRRFLPIVIPGIAISGGAALGWLAARPRRGAAVVAGSLALVIAGLEARSVMMARAIPYYEGNFATVDAFAARLPEDAIVAMDVELSDLQIQVPLWLLTGRETVMLPEGGQRWRDAMSALVATGRPVVWIGDRRASTSDLSGIDLRPLDPDLDLRLVLPDGPANTLPSRRVTRLVPLRAYGVGTGVGRSAGSTCFLCAYSSRVTAWMMNSTRYGWPLPSVPTTDGWYDPSFVYTCTARSPVVVGDPSPKSQT